MKTEFFRSCFEECVTISYSELFDKAREYKRLQDEKEAEKDKISECRKQIEDLQEAIMRAKTKIDFDKYALEWYSDDAKGYYFRYTRLIGGYQSSNRFSVKVGYDGTIVYISDFSNVYEGKNLDYTKEYIDNKIKEFADESKVKWDGVCIIISEGKVCADFTLYGEVGALYCLPLE